MVVCGEMLLKFLTKVIVIQNFRVIVIVRLEPKNREPNLSAFRDRGVLGPTSEMSPRAPAQMGRREAEREGAK